MVTRAMKPSLREQIKQSSKLANRIRKNSTLKTLIKVLDIPKISLEEFFKNLQSKKQLLLNCLHGKN
jgi:hypothetical protein